MGISIFLFNFNSAVVVANMFGKRYLFGQSIMQDKICCLSDVIQEADYVFFDFVEDYRYGKHVTHLVGECWVLKCEEG